MRQIGWHRDAVDRDPGQRLELDARRVEVLAGLGQPGARRLQALFGLLLIGDADRALRHTFAKVAGQLLVEGRIVVRDRHQPLLQQIIDVSAGNIERDELRPFLDPRCSGVGARCLTANFRLASAHVEQQLVGGDARLERIKRLVGNADRATGRILQLANAGRCFDRYPRQPQPFGLPALGLGRILVGDRLPDLRIGIQGRLNGVLQFHRRGGRCGQDQRS